MLLSSPSLPPFVCARCQETPHNPADLFVDTQIDFPNPTGGDGRLYLCPRCAGLVAAMLGWFDPAREADLLAQLDDARVQIARLNSTIENRDDVLRHVAREAAREVLKEQKTPAPKPAPARKPPAKKPDADAEPKRGMTLGH